jgi:hypothetical protein
MIELPKFQGLFERENTLPDMEKYEASDGVKSILLCRSTSNFMGDSDVMHYGRLLASGSDDVISTIRAGHWSSIKIRPMDLSPKHPQGPSLETHLHNAYFPISSRILENCFRLHRHW